MTATETAQHEEETEIDIGSSLRIACLIPSATDICVALGLSAWIVGVTHECRLDDALDPKVHVHVLTENKLGPSSLSQAEIHQAVQDNADAQRSSCGFVPSLYPIDTHAFQAAAPTVILTQDLCSVCAPSSSQVTSLIHHTDDELTDQAQTQKPKPSIVSLTPHCLVDVLENIETVAAACQVRKRGYALRRRLEAQLEDIRQTVVVASASATTQVSNDASSSPSLCSPRILVLEWLDPPFDGGHWIDDMLQLAGATSCTLPLGVLYENHKLSDMDTTSTLPKISKHITWKDVERLDPDVIIVACCGFDLSRNVRDAIAMRHELMHHRAVTQNRLFCVDGDQYCAKPGPTLVQGTLLFAMCAHANNETVVSALSNLSWIHSDTMKGYQRVDLNSSQDQNCAESLVLTSVPTMIERPSLLDVEDCWVLHKRACENNETFYIDPDTGYNVFTEVAHVQRGKCCGSGCRHCPFGHKNVRDKVSKIQQPAMLHKGDLDLLDVSKHSTCKVLFFSGGKDSFLTIRAVVRQRQEVESMNAGFGLVLLTTFDATSREIAHQEMPVSVVVRQAVHLGLTMVGVPMHRGSSELYQNRIQRGLHLIRCTFEVTVCSLVFGDLHLAHVYQWRMDNLTSTSQSEKYNLEFPLFQTPYENLLEDLEKSGIRVVVVASTIDDVHEGDVYDMNFRKRLTCDVMGENGEFHTEAQVWTVPRNHALGITE